MTEPYNWVYWVGHYMEWSKSVFGTSVPPIIDSDNIKCVCSFPGDSKYGKIALAGIFNAELAYCEDLFADLRDNNVLGDIVEFGIFRGDWINRLFEMTEKTGFRRPIIGFDSFEGLSSPDPVNDAPFWKEGMFAAGMDEVRRYTKANERPRISFIPGWFKDSLPSDQAQAINEISYARIDCDIYQPCKECLHYLGPRLSHGSILVFDDWSHNTTTGEGRAFAEWAPTVPHLEFEFIFFAGWDHFYLRVWHKDKPRWEINLP